ncbi:hypothetical protein C8A00DRAFT_35700 [Chaetomidium leptoderma]|uniref:Uncharacterized protein n=1 Tax=Chaetomidium leptoderma TaxID=669021 RepID=A0AAN6ZVC8_9PEZI|nr:hypothetical protein C8A00DRAFT_35700 [Chaetomidium leptoderma]
MGLGHLPVCSYANEFDGGWDDLERRIGRMRESIAENSDAPGIAETMDFVLVQDPALEGASVRELQRRFQDWARGADNMDTSNAQGSRGGLEGWPCEPGSKDWMKVRAGAVETELYAELDDPEAWYAYYTPPECGVCPGW